MIVGTGYKLKVASLTIVGILSLGGCAQIDTPTGAPANVGETWSVNFSYTRMVTGKATGNNVTVEQNEAENYQGQLHCTRAPDDSTGTNFDCSGTGAANYSSRASCTDAKGLTSHAEEAKPWTGDVHGTLTFDWQAQTWSLTVNAPAMQIHFTDVSFGKTDEKDSDEQVITDLYVADEKLNADGLTGSHHESGDQTDDLQFGSCDTGVNASTEKADLNVDLSR